MAKTKTFLKVFSGLRFDSDPMDIRPQDSPLLLDCFSIPKGGLSSPLGSTKLLFSAKSGTIYGLFQYISRKSNQTIISISNGTIDYE